MLESDILGADVVIRRGPPSSTPPSINMIQEITSEEGTLRLIVHATSSDPMIPQSQLLYFWKRGAQNTFYQGDDYLVGAEVTLSAEEAQDPLWLIVSFVFGGDQQRTRKPKKDEASWIDEGERWMLLETQLRSMIENDPKGDLHTRPLFTPWPDRLIPAFEARALIGDHPAIYDKNGVYPSEKVRDYSRSYLPITWAATPALWVSAMPVSWVLWDEVMRTLPKKRLDELKGSCNLKITYINHIDIT